MVASPARELIDSLDDNAAARIDAFIDRLRVYGIRMQGKFVKKLSGNIFELRVKQFDRIFRILFFISRERHHFRISEEVRTDPSERNCESGEASESVVEIPQPVYRIKG